MDSLLGRWKLILLPRWFRGRLVWSTGSSAASLLPTSKDSQTLQDPLVFVSFFPYSSAQPILSKIFLDFQVCHFC
jgi:hypothetical protein